LTKTLIELFREHLILEEKSDATIQKYCRDVYAFAAYADGAVITKELVIAYKNKLKEGGYAIRSINSILSSINSLFAFLGWYDLKAKSIKMQQKIFVMLTTK
jgi:site-specific recombinase XerD